MGAVPSALGEGSVASVLKVMALRSSALFARVPPGALAALADQTSELLLPKGRALFYQGDPGRTTYLILRGRVRVHIGEETLAERGRGTVIGEFAAISPEVRSATITALEDTEMLGIGRRTLYDLFSDEPGVLSGFVDVLVQKFRDAHPAPPREE